MKRFIISALVLTLALTTFNTIALAQGRGGGNGNGGSNGNGGNGGNGGNSCSGILSTHLESLPIEDLSPAELADITYMREEEKLARDVYATLALSWDIPIFSQIARAEQRHMDQVGAILERYDAPDPVADDTIGVFTNSELQTLFSDLVISGESSLEAALRVGATIEDLDIADLEEMIAETDNLDVRFIGYNLAKGSRNHLRAFSKVLATNDFEPYSAQYLEQDAVDAIVSSDRERGVIYDEYGDVLTTNGRCGNCGEQGPGNGRGRGRGQGRGQGQGRGTGTCSATG